MRIFPKNGATRSNKTQKQQGATENYNKQPSILWILYLIY